MNFEIQAHDAAQVFANVQGKLVEIHKKPGETVQAGDVIMKLENEQLRYELVGMKGQLEEAEQRLSSLRRARFSDSDLVDQLAAAGKDRDAKKKLYDDKQKEVDRLTIVAPRDGTIIPIPHKVDRAAQAEGRLATWSGSPFDAKNLNATFQPSDILCQVGDPSDLDAVLVIDQSYIDYVQEGHVVRVNLSEPADGVPDEVDGVPVRTSVVGPIVAR